MRERNSHIDPVTLSDSPRSLSTRNHWALLTKNIDEKFLHVEEVFGHGPAAQERALYATGAAVMRHDHAVVGATYANLGQGTEYTHRTEKGDVSRVHTHKTKSEGKGDDSDEAFEAYKQGKRRSEPELEIRTVEHGPFYGGPGVVIIFTKAYYDNDGRYRGAVPDPEHGASFGWHVVNGQLKPIDPFE